MPRHLNPLAHWLGSLPGPIIGPSLDEALAKAQAAYEASGGAPMEPEAFKLALKSAGYLPCRQYLDPDTGEWVNMLQLPESSRQ